MLIGDRLRELREQKKFSQGEVERRTGLLRCYTSRVENGHTVPAVETLQKYAQAFEVPLYQLFYDGDQPPKPPKLPKGKVPEIEWGTSGKEARLLAKFRHLLSRMDQNNLNLLLSMANKMARKKSV